MEAILLLSNCIDNEWESMLQSIDLVLKWSTFRICDNNVQALGKTVFVIRINSDCKITGVTNR